MSTSPCDAPSHIKHLTEGESSPSPAENGQLAAGLPDIGGPAVGGASTVPMCIRSESAPNLLPAQVIRCQRVHRLSGRCGEALEGAGVRSTTTEAGGFGRPFSFLVYTLLLARAIERQRERGRFGEVDEASPFTNLAVADHLAVYAVAITHVI